MKVFVYEYCCASPLRGEATARALRSEGLAMLTAVMSDFTRIDGVESVALVAEDAPPLPFPCRRTLPTRERRHFRRLASESDYSLIIAPEIDGILHNYATLVLKAGGKLLGPDPEAIRLTADKLWLYFHFVKYHISTPPTCHLATVGHPVRADLLPGVLKPRFGVGSLSMRQVRRSEDIGAAVEANPSMEYLLQRHVPGTAASVAFLLGPRQCIALKPAAQSISTDGRFQYLGGSVPLKEPLARRARNLARRAVRSVPGLMGYVGVDLVLGHRVDGSEDYVLEINPRLTTSYIGLRQLTNGNLMGSLLAVAQDHITRVSWRRGKRVSWVT